MVRRRSMDIEYPSAPVEWLTNYMDNYSTTYYVDNANNEEYDRRRTVEEIVERKHQDSVLSSQKEQPSDNKKENDSKSGALLDICVSVD